jgi:hypothetical protein
MGTQKNNALYALESLRVGCPKSGQGPSCEATKSCKSQGGIIHDDL